MRGESVLKAANEQFAAAAELISRPASRMVEQAVLSSMHRCREII
jgi:hypothetical protein